MKGDILLRQFSCAGKRRMNLVGGHLGVMLKEFFLR
jgi:hypothetical protein